MPLLSQTKDLEICRLLAGWDSLEKRLGGSPIIDFNLPKFFDPDHETRYTSRLEVFESLKTLKQDPEIQVDKRLTQKLHAHEIYLRNMMGEHWDFTSYIENTAGFTPRLVREDRLQMQRDRIEEILRPYNLRIDEKFEDRLSEIQEDISQAQIPGFYHEVYARSAATLSAIVGAIPHFDLTIEFDDVDAYWKNWVDGGQKKFRLRFNKRTIPHFDKAFCTLMALHEIVSHLVQAAFIYQKIEHGQTPLCMGLTSVHGPEQFGLEGLAMTMPYFLDIEDTQDPLVKAACDVYLYEKMVWNNNAHIMINSDTTIEACIDYVTQRMPYKTRREVAHSLASSRNDPQLRCYKHVYGGSAIFFQDIGLRSDQAQKREFLKRVYHDWLPVDELYAFRQDLLSAG